MKMMLSALVVMLTAVSCVFEEPFEPVAKLPVDEALPGVWEEIPKTTDGAVNRLLVLRHSDNEYLVEYPMGEKAMYFRAYAVDLAGGRYIQIQLIGTADGPVKAEDRKYHLLQTAIDGAVLEVRTVNPDVLGKELKHTKDLRNAFAVHRNDPGLFGEPQRFRRIK